MKPWNKIAEVPFSKYHKNEIIKWYNTCMNDVLKDYNKEDLRYISKTKYFKEQKLNYKTKKYLEEFYNDGYGFKLIARALNLTYSRIRFVFKVLNINTRKGQKIVTENLKRIRSERVKGTNNPWSDWECRKNVNSWGIQGIYKRKDGREIWIRSACEYIIAKLLDDQEIIWEYEYKQYKLSNNETYTPDFTIFYKDKINYVIEHKGKQLKSGYKAIMLEKEYKIPTIIIDNIHDYCDCYVKELEEWKAIVSEQKKLKK